MTKRLLVIVAASLAVAAPATAGPPAFDKAEGAGSYLRAGCTIGVPEGRGPYCFATDPLVTRTFSFSAIQYGFGERANGTYTQDANGGTTHFVGRVTCLNVLANTAVFGGVVTESSVAPYEGLPFVVWVVDNGSATDGGPPDLISPVAIFPQGDEDLPLLPAAFPNICPQPFPSLFGYFPLESGNIVVEDESPPGTSLTR